MAKFPGYSVLPDEREDIQQGLQNTFEFLNRLASIWKDNRVNYFLVLPVDMVDLLDEASGICTCEENDCREICYADWDYCFNHGQGVVE